MEFVSDPERKFSLAEARVAAKLGEDPEGLILAPPAETDALTPAGWNDLARPSQPKVTLVVIGTSIASDC